MRPAPAFALTGRLRHRVSSVVLWAQGSRIKDVWPTKQVLSNPDEANAQQEVGSSTSMHSPLALSTLVYGALDVAHVYVYSLVMSRQRRVDTHFPSHHDAIPVEASPQNNEDGCIGVGIPVSPRRTATQMVCARCGLAFTRVDALKRHMKDAHGQ